MNSFSLPPMHTCHLALQEVCPACFQERQHRAKSEAYLVDAGRFLKTMEARRMITPEVAKTITDGQRVVIGAAMSFARENVGVTEEGPGGIRLGHAARFGGLDFLDIQDIVEKELEADLTEG